MCIAILKMDNSGQYVVFESENQHLPKHEEYSEQKLQQKKLPVAVILS